MANAENKNQIDQLIEGTSPRYLISVTSVSVIPELRHTLCPINLSPAKTLTPGHHQL